MPAFFIDRYAVRALERIPDRESRRRQRLRLLKVVSAIVLLIGLLVAGFYQRARIQYSLRSAQEWSTEQLAAFEVQLGEIVDNMTLRYYDRREPTRTPVQEIREENADSDTTGHSD